MDSRALSIKEDLVQQSQHDLHPLPLLLRRGTNLVRGQHEAKVARIAQLNRIAPIRLTSTIDIIHTTPRRRIERATAGPKSERNTIDLPYGVGHQPRQVDMLAQVVGVQRAVEPPRREDVLPVAVPVDVELDTARVAQRVHELRQPLVLRRVARRLALVHQRARVSGSPQRVAVPLVRPVAVDVPPEAGLVGRRRWRRLPVLAPEAFRRL